MRRFQEDLKNKKRIIVGVNEFLSDEALPIDIFRVPEEFEKSKIAKLNKLRSSRDNSAVRSALDWGC